MTLKAYLNVEYQNTINYYYYGSLCYGLLHYLYYLLHYKHDIDSINLEFFNKTNDRFKTSILVVLILLFGTLVSNIIDILGDYFFNVKDMIERLILFSITSISTFVLYFDSNYSKLGHFTTNMIIQHICYMSVIIALSIKLSPIYFVKPNILLALISVSFGGIMFIEAAYKNNAASFNIIGFIFYIIGILIYLHYIRKWFMLSLWNNKNIDTIAIKDLSLLSYVLIWVLTLVILPIIPISMAQFNIINIGYIEALFLLYLNLLFFSLGSSTSRIINYLIKLKKNKELKRKESLIRFLCHEIRSPLNIIQTGLNLLQHSERKDTEVIADMTSECGAAINILNSLLENEKIESLGSINIRCCYVDCSSIVNTFERYKLIAKVSNIQYEIVSELNKVSNNYVLLVDVHKIEQVIRNLITNAVKYTSKGGLVTVTIKICELNQTTDLPGYCGYSFNCDIKDSGMGIPLKLQNKVFSQFSQFSDKSLGGSGLGLYISKNIAELHHGTLTFYSEGENTGSTFTLSLPLYEKEMQTAINVEIEENSEEKIHNMVSSHNLTPPTSINSSVLESFQSIVLSSNQVFPDNLISSEKPTVLIMVADDSALNRKYLIRSLEKLFENKMNMEIKEVDDGIKVIDYISSIDKKQFPHAIFIDNIMMKMNGPETIKELRKMKYDGIIIGCSGNVFEEDIAKFFESGAEYFLPKPFIKKILETICDEIYNRKTNGLLNKL